MFPRDEADDWHPPLGEIHLPGDQIVSHRHRALDRFEEWQRINSSRIRKMGTRQRWDMYISDPACNMLAASSPSSSPEEKEERQVVGAPASKMGRK
ncbi:hypothetical protein FRB97_007612 [Tulasnella sp. 331]|nr:hypothetical protein FRB97_007612 [Tulasnella sp. 331]